MLTIGTFQKGENLPREVIGLFFPKFSDRGSLIWRGRRDFIYWEGWGV